MSDVNTLTQKDYDNLKELLKELTEVEKPKAEEELNFARSQGDLSENSDYDAAKEKFEQIKKRISELEYQIDHAVIVEKPLDNSSVGAGCRVKAINLDTGKEYNFEIVGASAADPINWKISITSPVGEALSTHKVGDICKVDSPKPYSLKIVEISY